MNLPTMFDQLMWGVTKRERIRVINNTPSQSVTIIARNLLQSTNIHIAIEIRIHTYSRQENSSRKQLHNIREHKDVVREYNISHNNL